MGCQTADALNARGITAPLGGQRYATARVSRSPLESAEAKALSTSAPDHRRFFLHAPEAHIITQHPVALQLRTLQTMAEIATEKN